MGDVEGRPVRHRRRDWRAQTARAAEPRRSIERATSSAPGSTARTSRGARAACGSSTSASTCRSDEAALYEAPFEYVRAARQARSRSGIAATAYAERLVAACEAAARNARGARGPAALHRHARRPQAPALRLAPMPRRSPTAPSSSFAARRRLHLRHPALARPRGLGPRHGHAAPRGRVRLPLHAHDLLRDLPVPATPHPSSAPG